MRSWEKSFCYYRAIESMECTVAFKILPAVINEIETKRKIFVTFYIKKKVAQKGNLTKNTINS